MDGGSVGRPTADGRPVEGGRTVAWPLTPLPPGRDTLRLGEDLEGAGREGADRTEPPPLGAERLAAGADLAGPPPRGADARGAAPAFPPPRLAASAIASPQKKVPTTNIANRLIHDPRRAVVISHLIFWTVLVALEIVPNVNYSVLLNI